MSDWYTISVFELNRKKLEGLGVDVRLDGLTAAIHLDHKVISISSPEEFNGFVLGVEFMKGELERGENV